MPSKVRRVTVSLAFRLFTQESAGQYTLAVAYQGISNFGFQTACNVRMLMFPLSACGTERGFIR